MEQCEIQTSKYTYSRFQFNFSWLERSAAEATTPAILFTIKPSSFFFWNFILFLVPGKWLDTFFGHRVEYVYFQ